MNLPRVSQKWSEKMVVFPEYQFPEIITKEIYSSILETARPCGQPEPLIPRNIHTRHDRLLTAGHPVCIATRDSHRLHDLNVIPFHTISLSLSFLLEAIFMCYCTARPWKCKQQASLKRRYLLYQSKRRYLLYQSKRRYLLYQSKRRYLLYQSKRRNINEDSNLHQHRCENPKPCVSAIYPSSVTQWWLYVPPNVSYKLISTVTTVNS